MNPDTLKQLAARAAIEYLEDGAVVGVGSGSTVGYFIRELGAIRSRIAGAVSSSQRSSELLREQGIAVLSIDAVQSLPVYVDGADEVDPKLALIKGGGGALTREKIIAEISERFVCIVDRSKRVDVLGGFALPIEVIPMACAQVTRAIAQLGGVARLREGFISDNGNPILDVHGLRISDPLAMETEINQWPGVVTVGLFARRRADIVLVADSHGIQTLEP